MAIRKTGARRIVVDGVSYRWRVRHRATNLQADYGGGRLHLAVELADGAGAVLVINSDRPHPQDVSTKPGRVRPVKPSDVTEWVREAIRTGWKPAEPGPQFLLRLPV